LPGRKTRTSERLAVIKGKRANTDCSHQVGKEFKKVGQGTAREEHRKGERNLRKPLVKEKVGAENDKEDASATSEAENFGNVTHQRNR